MFRKDVMIRDEKLPLFGDYVFDTARGCLLRDGRPVHLRRQSYDVLKHLVENRGHLISKDKLIEEVWQGRAVTDGSLQKCIEEVREALGPDARKYVRNERGRGYIFDPEIVENGGPSRESHQAKNRTIPAVLVLSILVIAGAAAAFVFAKYFSARSPEINSIAVLPFVNASADPSAAYVSDGLTENLIDELAKSPDLKVIARSSSFTYKGRDVDVQDVGRALAVTAVVTGSLEQRGDSLVVSAELVDARDRSRLWGGQYTRKMNELQQLQGEIARAIAGKLQVRLITAQQRQLSKHHTVNPQAYELYMNGLFHYNQGSSNGIIRALEYFNQAVLLDPNFALAWAWVSRANNNLGGNSLLNPKETQAKAKAAAQRALELDETLADAHFALARIKRDEWDWNGAEQEYKRAIELSPSLAFARAGYADFLSTMTRHTEALSEIKRAQQLDPMSVRLKRREAWFLHLARRTDEGIALMRKMLHEASPPHYGLGFMYESKGLYEQSIQEFRAMIAIDGERTANLCYLAGALAAARRKKEALQIVERLNRSKDYVSPTELAAVHARLKNTEAVITLLEKAYVEHDPQLQILNVDPFFDYLRSDPRFQDLLRRVGLPSSLASG